MSTATALRPAGGGDPRPLVFDGEEVRVVDARGFGSSTCVVTFSSFSDQNSLDREGFGESFLRGEGVDALHVLSLRNLWWAHDETLPAMTAVRAAVADYDRVVAYGSSMGGYGAARLADAAGAGVVLAMSPQFSILPSVAPFEHRWKAASAAIDPAWEAALPVARPREAYLVHDPADLDGRHVALFARAGMPFTPVRLRNVGHHTAGFLQEVGLLRPFVLETIAGPPDVASLEREAWRRRRGSPQHLLTLADRLHAPEHRLALVRRADALAPESAALLSRLGGALAAVGEFEAALAAHDRALALMPGWGPLVAERAATARAAAALRPESPAHGALKPVDPGVRAHVGAPPILAPAGARGCVLNGPFRVLRPGRYEVSFGVHAAEPPRGFTDLHTVATIDVFAAGRVLAGRRLSGRTLRRRDGRVSLAFTLAEPLACEFRVHTRGRMALRVDPDRPCRRTGRAS